MLFLQNLTLFSSLNHLNHHLSLEPLTQDSDPQLPLLSLPPMVAIVGREETGRPCSTKNPVVLCPLKSCIFFPVCPSSALPVLNSLAFLRGALPHNSPPALGILHLELPSLFPHSKDRLAYKSRSHSAGSLIVSSP